MLQGDSPLVLQVQDSYLQDSWDGGGVGVNSRARRADSLNGFVGRPVSLMLLPGLGPSPCHTLRFRQLLEPTKLVLPGPHRGCTRWNTSPLLVPSPLNMSASMPLLQRRLPGHSVKKAVTESPSAAALTTGSISLASSRCPEGRG